MEVVVDRLHRYFQLLGRWMVILQADLAYGSWSRYIDRAIFKLSEGGSSQDSFAVGEVDLVERRGGED